VASGAFTSFSVSTVMQNNQMSIRLTIQSKNQDQAPQLHPSTVWNSHSEGFQLPEHRHEGPFQMPVSTWDIHVGLTRRTWDCKSTSFWRSSKNAGDRGHLKGHYDTSVMKTGSHSPSFKPLFKCNLLRAHLLAAVCVAHIMHFLTALL